MIPLTENLPPTPSRSLQLITGWRNLSVQEFLTVYNIGHTTFYAEVAAGRLKIFKVGKKTLVTVEAAEQWRRAHVNKPLDMYSVKGRPR